MRFLSWLAAAAMMLTGCGTRINPYYPNPGGNPGGTPGGGGGQGGQGGGNNTQTVTKRTDWGTEYKGRAVFDNETLEEFLFTYTGSNYFILATISDADFEAIYKSDAKALIEGELKDLRNTASNNNVAVTALKNVFTKTDKTKYFDVMIHGEYNAFLLELDKQGNPTYNYAVSKIEIRQEEATEGYLNWIGVWTVSDGYVGYDIEISAFENNYLYRVDGWETGPAAGTVQMNQDDDWIQARFLKDDASLSFFIQFIASYSDYENLGDVDYMFVGTYVESEGEKVDDYEGVEVAYALNTGGDTQLQGGCTEYMVNGEIYKPHFNAMHYSLYSYQNSAWTHFHEAIPIFREKAGYAIDMVRTKAASGVDRTPVHTRNYLRKTAPRVHSNERKSLR